MAPVLLCPECGEKHPLDGAGGSAFPCKGCGRMLKVPQQVPVAAAPSGAPATAAAPAVDPDLPWPKAAGAEPASTRVLPTSPPPAPAPKTAPPASKPRRAAKLDPVPARWIRFAIWIVAVPLGFVIVFAVARAAGMLNSNQLQDVVITDGWNRFWPLARLLPFVALVTAGLVQGAVYGLTRLRERRAAPPGPGRAPQRKAA
jgi:hypothetical protein